MKKEKDTEESTIGFFKYRNKAILNMMNNMICSIKWLNKETSFML